MLYEVLFFEGWAKRNSIKMTTVEKLQAVQTSPEILRATKLLIAAFHDCELKSHIRFTFKVHDIKYELNFMPILNEITYKADEVAEGGKK